MKFEINYYAQGKLLPSTVVVEAKNEKHRACLPFARVNVIKGVRIEKFGILLSE
jgi:hypothetical protein